VVSRLTYVSPSPTWKCWPSTSLWPQSRTTPAATTSPCTARPSS
jgi:hypothetical protein